jgi:hypothetical protein
MILADKVPYFRRLTVKLVEMAAAGIGTAVTGYLVAYITGHFSLFMPSEVAPALQQAVSWHAVTPKDAAPKNTASIEATVRAALASHDVGHDGSDAVTPAAVTPPTTLASTEAPATVPAIAPPLATAEIKTLPVAVASDPIPSEPDGWPTEPSRVATTGSLLPPQPPPANFNPLAALKHFF